jgi:NADH-ubiquinone oxidoreductase chain 1
MTEHAAVVFVFFFLAEYASIVLICTLSSILFLGGYLFDYLPLFNLGLYLNPEYYEFNVVNGVYVDNTQLDRENIKNFLSDPLVEGLLGGLTLGIKSCIMIFVFI